MSIVKYMQFMKRLPQSFYARDTHRVAKDLLGKVLVRKIGKDILQGRICEVESYQGENDKACHASKGKTKRTEIMYGPAGYAYVYMIYGMYHCLNVVTEVENFPAAVLIRAVVPMQHTQEKTDGPGKLCRAFFISRAQNGITLAKSDELFIADDGTRIAQQGIFASERIGVAYAGDDALLPWRYFYSK